MRNQQYNRNNDDYSRGGGRGSNQYNRHRDDEGRFASGNGGNQSNDNWRYQERDEDGRFAGYEDQGSGSSYGRGNYDDDYGFRGSVGRSDSDRGGFSGNNFGSGMTGNRGGERQNTGGNTGSGNQGRDHFDSDYHHWRNEQIGKLDDDYTTWQSERRQKFSDEFGKWRTERESKAGSNQTSNESKKQS